MSAIDRSLGLSGVLALRAQILDKSQSLGVATTAKVAATDAGSAPTSGANGFGAVMDSALKAVQGAQAESSAKGAAYERGETHDIAGVMLSRQKASIAFEATLQARNRLLSAYRDIMNMPV